MTGGVAELQTGAEAHRPPKVPPLLSIESLTVEFRTRSGTVHALEDVGFTVGRGETVGIVGESGSGKSVTAYSLMGLLDPAARILRGSAIFDGTELLRIDERAMQGMRGRDMSMIFQNPRSALNPIRTVGRQIADVLIRLGERNRSRLRERTLEVLSQVRIPDPVRRARSYPFELSGGMCQRIVIALAIICEPRLLIADEPTTGLDVTTQAEIMDLVKDLARRKNLATILITHDLALAAEHCDRIVVMHAGHVVEIASTSQLFRSPRHPYAARLIAATPTPGSTLSELASIPGGLPDLRRDDLPPCRYADRCDRRGAACDVPPLPRVGDGANFVACRFPL